MFLEEISIWFSRLNGIKKVREGWVLSLSLSLFPSWTGPSISSFPSTSKLLALRPLGLNWELHLRLLWFSGFQTQTKLYHWLSWFPSLQIVGLYGFYNMWVNSYNKSPHIYHVFYWFCFSGELRPIHQKMNSSLKSLVTFTFSNWLQQSFCFISCVTMFCHLGIKCSSSPTF